MYGAGSKRERWFWDYFRRVKSIIDRGILFWTNSNEVDEILRSNLAFNYRDYVRAGDHLLCAEVRDSDLPWKLDQVD